jgi:hypothetical protein
VNINAFAIPKNEVGSSHDLLLALGSFIGSFLGFVGHFSSFLLYKLAIMTKYVCKYYYLHKIRFFADIIYAIILVAFGLAGNAVYQISVDSQIEASLITDIDRYNKDYRREFRREVASNDPREFMDVGGPTWLRHSGIKAVITEARKAELSIMETSVWLAVAQVESGFNPLAKAQKTTACGVNQFLKTTGEQFGLSASACFNPGPNAHAQAKHFKKIMHQPVVQAALYKKTGRERLIAMFHEVYCLHHDGVNTKSCSSVVDEMTQKGLPMLLGSYKTLNTAQVRTMDANFLYAVYDTLNDMQFWVTSKFESMLALIQ